MIDNFFEQENEYVRNNFNIEEILEFINSHDVQIIRGADWQYECYINKKCYYIGLTHLYSLLLGIKIYKENEKKERGN
jgi:hypothetical protein